MALFKRSTVGVTTTTEQKLDVPDGLWFKCPSCKTSLLSKDLKLNKYVCSQCEYHCRIGSAEYFEIIFDEDTTIEIDANLTSGDPLSFTDTKPYVDRLKAAQAKTGLKDAIRTAVGKVEGETLVVTCMDFDFIGGSMGSVMGEKIARAIDKARELDCPVMIISKSGGARMMEAAFSLMQMAKTSAKLAMAAEEKVPYISLMTDPTTGGVTASFAMLGDFNLAEPKALIGFAGPRVIKETIKKDLPKGFQSAEMVLESGFIDFIVDRRALKSKLSQVIKLLKN
jgi:acetyl-CoA carboxylase carboxyl transferase subunit beta